MLSLQTYTTRLHPGHGASRINPIWLPATANIQHQRSNERQACFGFLVSLFAAFTNCIRYRLLSGKETGTTIWIQRHPFSFSFFLYFPILALLLFDIRPNQIQPTAVRYVSPCPSSPHLLATMLVMENPIRACCQGKSSQTKSKPPPNSF